jgi:hypothetical protein
MRRLALAAAVALGAAATASGAIAPGGAYLRSFACHRSLDPAQRVVSVTAVMPTIAGTERLKMRFELVGRGANGALAPVRAGDLGRWISPTPITLGRQPGDVWILRHPVTGVPVPAAYHFRVTFRWIDASGGTLTELVRSSASCWQPDLRPDLVVDSINVQSIAGDTSHDRYIASIGDAGLSPATAVQVLFAPSSGAPTQTVTIPRLRAHGSRLVSFIGPVCTSATAPTITVDPAARVDDLNRANNSLTATCPPSPQPARPG